MLHEKHFVFCLLFILVKDIPYKISQIYYGVMFY